MFRARLLLVILLCLPACSHEARPSSSAEPASAALHRVLRVARAAGTAHIDATLTTPSTGPPVHLVGLVSLVGPQALLVADTPAAAGTAPSVEIRVNADRAWVRAAPDAPWIEAPTQAPGPAGVAAGPSWSSLFDDMAAASATARWVRAGSIEIGTAPRRATVRLDAQGRLAGLYVRRQKATMDVTFSGFGTALRVDPP